MRGGRPFTRGHIYRILSNPIYIGRVPHKKESYPGQHPAIIDQVTWEAVQQRMDRNRAHRRNGGNAKHPSRLAGKLFDEKGAPFTPSHAVKNGRRYRYYIERRDEEANPKKGIKLKRIPAEEVEVIVANGLAHFLQKPTQIIPATESSKLNPEKTKALVDRASALAKSLRPTDTNDHRTIPSTLIKKVIIGEVQVQVTVSRQGLYALLEIDGPTSADNDHDYEIVVPARLRPRGVEMKFVIMDEERPNGSKSDQTLIRSLIKAHTWLEKLLKDDRYTINRIADEEGVTGPYIRRLLNLAFLAPDIQEAILEGCQPPNISAEYLLRHADVPLGWQDQRQVLGFRN